MVPPLTLCAYMKKGPNLRWSLIQCSGGDEGDRTPDLLTARQALSQLSYAPVRKSTIRELERRCKDNFRKTSGGAGWQRDGAVPDPRPGAGKARPRPDHARGARPAGGGIAAARLSGARPAALRDARHESRPSTTFGRHPPTIAPWTKLKPQVDGLRFYRNRGYGRGVRPKRSRWAGSVAAAPRTADLGRPEAARRPLIDRFPANCTGRQLVTPFPQSFEPWFCIYSVILSASKDFARLHQAAQRR